MTRTLHIITPEYPPQCGGVGDFCRILAAGLVGRGASVEVWCPPAGRARHQDGVAVHPTLGNFGHAAREATDRALDAFPKPRRLLVQWVPHGYGWKGMNLPFCWWIHRRRRRGDIVELMVHEPFVEFGGAFRHRILAVVQRAMAAILLRAATRVWCAIPMWDEVLRPYAPCGSEFLRLPMFATVPADPHPASSIASEFAFGHFGSLGPASADPLAAVLPPLLAEMPEARVLLVGHGGLPFLRRCSADHPSLAVRLAATGSVAPDGVSGHLKTCDVMLQPVRGGVTGRNTSVLAGLANGRAIVTTSGRLTEPYWADSGAVMLAPDGDALAFADAASRLASDTALRTEVERAGLALSARYFRLDLLLDALLP